MTQKMIRKRDGRLVEFHTEKIRNAIWRSFLGVGQTGMEDVSDALARKVETMLELEGCEPEVEHVQDLVEQVLMQEGYGRTAKAYILYREERSRARQVNSSLMRKFEEITFKDAADSDIKRENANIDGDTAMGTMLRYGSEAAKQFSESFLMKPEYATAHERGDIHIHDLSMLEEKIQEKGMTEEGLEQYLDAFRFGMPPHGGLGIGLERLTMQLLGEDNVREACLFPRDMSRLEP